MRFFYSCFFILVFFYCHIVRNFYITLFGIVKICCIIAVLLKTNKMLSLNEKLSNALTEKGYSHTQGQIDYVLNCKHELTFNKRFCELMNASIYMEEMIETFLNLSNLTKFESDFRNL